MLVAKNLTLTHLPTGNILLNCISFAIQPGQCMGLVGESGSGKTLLATLALQHLDMTQWDIQGSLETTTSKTIVFQDPMSTFHPLCTLRNQIKDYAQSAQIFQNLPDLLVKLQVSQSSLDAYPNQLSGGTLQRILIAICLAQNTQLLILDEPTTGLDAANTNQLLELLRWVRQNYNLAILFISHDLVSVQSIAESIFVLYKGECMEYIQNIQNTGNTDLAFAPKHPYTQGLWNSGKWDVTSKQFTYIPLEIAQSNAGLSDAPSMAQPHTHACVFYPRCAKRTDICVTKPAWGLKVRCWLNHTNCL
jgi:ABC-type dipeptide/oligopeptide/nickel transport system ATPase component